LVTIGAHVKNDIISGKGEIRDHEVENIRSIAGILGGIGMSIHHGPVAVPQHGRAGRLPDVGSTVPSIIENEGCGGSFVACDADSRLGCRRRPRQLIILPPARVPLPEAGGLLGLQGQKRRPVIRASSVAPEVHTEGFRGLQGSCHAPDKGEQES